MPSITLPEIATGAFQILGIFAPGEPYQPSDLQAAQTFTNDLLDEWSNRDGFIPIIARERFDTVANQGGPDLPYTIGPGGDFDTERPPNQNAVVWANLILTGSTPEVRIRLAILTDQTYDNSSIPDSSSGQPTALYYNPEYRNDLGAIYLYQVPTVSTNDIELFLQKAVAQMPSLTASYDVPTGLPRALKYNVAKALQSVYGVEMTAPAMAAADASLNAYKRSVQAKMTDQVNDATWATRTGRTLYNIQTGNY